jgi:S1-C subfamily serine protease
MVRTTAALVLTAAVAELLGAQTPRVSAPLAGISYESVRISQVGSTSAAVAAGARVGDQIVSIGDVMITNDDSFEKFRTRYTGTILTTLPLMVRRGSESLTLEVPVRLSLRVRTRVVPLANASAKASRIRHGILTGSPPSATPTR